MLNSKLMSDLRKMITKHFGGVSGCARELGVTRQTVMNWTVKNPRGMLKYAPEIVSTKGLDMDAVISRGYVCRRLAER